MAVSERRFRVLAARIRSFPPTKERRRMKAVVCRAFGPPESLTLEEVPDPQPTEGQVLIDVYAAGLNFPDVLQIAGKYQFQPPFPFTPGAEVAGVVAEVGASVVGVKKGDRVRGMTGIGGMAE